MKPAVDTARYALDQAHRALQCGDRRLAHRWAMAAVAQAPQSEAAWLVLASTASPRPSLAYLKKALEINPHNPHTRMQMHQAIQHLREEQHSAESPPPVVVSAPTSRQNGGVALRLHSAQLSAPSSQQVIRLRAPAPQRRVSLSASAWLFGAVGLLILAAGLLAWLSLPWLRSQLASRDRLPVALLPANPTVTPANPSDLLEAPAGIDSAALPIITPFAPVLPTSMQIPGATPAATLDGALPVAASPEAATEQAQKPKKASQPASRPARVDAEEAWIDVDLSSQRVYAYQGDQVLAKFTVSTGKAGTPTVTGQFRVYVKYRAATMYGPGYYLPGVPYVMYFYKGYGLHGTYWHNSFGVPTSHGCINLRTKDAAWLYQFASVGTVVNIHR